jgi:polyferredoxin
MVAGKEAVERVTVWECIGCGKIEMLRPCIGVCKDVKVDMVYAWQHQAALAAAAARAAALEGLVRRLACITPRAGEWESSYRALQAEARQALRGAASDAAQA